MTNLQTQFLGYINTSSLFIKYDGLQQFELDVNIIDTFDFTQLQITENVTLGKRIERFFEFYISQSKDYDLIKNNVQIINNKLTLGELDFIIYDKKEKRYLHIEHIYKFYLYDDSISNEINRYIGPNNNDTLYKKIVKLKNKQLPLLHQNETKKYLEDIKTDFIEQRICFKGNIFLPLHLVNKDIPLLNNSSIRGFYIKYEDFLSEIRFRSFLYFVPDKFDWVSDPSQNDIWKSYSELLLQINVLLTNKKSPLVWLNNKEGIKESFFITWW